MNRILVVDDEPSIRKALAMGLSCKDCEVDIAADGKTGIQLGAGKSYDVLLVDLCLPDMGGLEVIKAIKQTSPEVVPIMITGRGSLQSSIEAIRLEVSDYIEKPLNMQTIKNAINRGLEKRSRNILEMRRKSGGLLKVATEDFRAKDSGHVFQKNNEPEEFSQSIPMLVHQINNPLMCISGFAELAMNSLDNEEIAREYLYDIINGARDIARINQEIIKLGKAKINGDSIEELDLRSLLQDCLLLFKGLLDINEITVEKHFADHELTVAGSRFNLEQIFNNLILNAIHAMDSTPRKLLLISGSRDKTKHNVLIRIQDTGCGIPEESLGTIFTPYFTTKEHGTGLGMSVAKNLVEKLKGKITVESEAGKGTNFTIVLPVKENIPDVCING